MPVNNPAAFLKAFQICFKLTLYKFNSIKTSGCTPFATGALKHYQMPIQILSTACNKGHSISLYTSYLKND